MKFLRVFLLSALLAANAGAALATSSDDSIVLEDSGWITHRQDNILLIRTTDVILNTIFAELALPYDEFVGSDWSFLDLTPYDQVFVAMDGGTVTTGSVSNLANFVNAGGCLHIYGGTCWQEYAIALDTYLLRNDTVNYCWAISGYPQTTITDPTHYLAAGLPASYNFVNSAAGFYQTRSTDGAAAVAAMNGDGWPLLLSKTIGTGTFDICINSAYTSYWTAPTDYDWAFQVIVNMLTCGGCSPVDNSSWGAIKALYR